MQLYHNAISTCSQKVRMVLHEKALEVEDKLIDLQAGDQFDEAYIALNPDAVVPTLVDNGNVMIESTLINEYLQDAYPEISLAPQDSYERHQLRLFCKQIDDKLATACGVITYSIGLRPSLLARPKADVDAMIAKIPNARKRQMRTDVVELGVAAGQFKDAMLTHQSLFDAAETMLTARTWLVGETFSLADCALIPYVVRIDHLNQNTEINHRPNLKRWYEAVAARPSFAEAVTKWAAPAVIAMLGSAGDAVKDDIAKAMQT
jgi:glutathione S-transferase